MTDSLHITLYIKYETPFWLKRIFLLCSRQDCRQSRLGHIPCPAPAQAEAVRRTEDGNDCGCEATGLGRPGHHRQLHSTKAQCHNAEATARRHSPQPRGLGGGGKESGHGGKQSRRTGFPSRESLPPPACLGWLKRHSHSSALP